MEDNIKYDNSFMPQLKGVYTIQLFDKEGNLIEEHVKENVINRLGYTMAFYNYFMSAVARNSATKQYGENDYASTEKDVVIDQCYLSFLPYSDAEENLTNSMMTGKFVGRCKVSAQESVTDSWVGILNTGETATTIETDYSTKRKSRILRHIVMDYGTDRANGKINHVYLGNCINIVSAVRGGVARTWEIGQLPACEPLDIKILDVASPPATNGGNAIGNLSIDNENNILYMGVYMTYTGTNPLYPKDKIVAVDLNTNNYTIITLSNPETPNTYYKTYGAGYLWAWTGSTKFIYKHLLTGDFAEKIDISAITGYNNIFFNGTSYYENAKFGCTGDSTYLMVKFWERDTDPIIPTLHIILLNGQGTKVRDITIPQSRSLAVNIMSWDTTSSKSNAYDYLTVIKRGTKTYLNVNYGVYLGSALFRNDVTVNIHPTDEINYDDVPTANKPYGYGLDQYNHVMLNDTIYQSGYGNRMSYGIRIAKLLPWFSHVKLDADVLKTSANTMKVTYDLTCDWIYPFDKRYLR